LDLEKIKIAEIIFDIQNANQGLDSINPKFFGL